MDGGIVVDEVNATEDAVGWRTTYYPIKVTKNKPTCVLQKKVVYLHSQTVFTNPNRDMMKTNNILFADDITNWDVYLNDVHEYLTYRGFKKYNQNHKKEDFAYWRIYDGYQIGLLIYDWRKYPRHTDYRKVSIQFECTLLDIDSRCDLSVNKEIELAEFEDIARSFHGAMSGYMY